MKFTLITLSLISVLWSSSILLDQRQEAMEKENSINLALNLIKVQFPNLKIQQSESADNVIVGGCVDKNTIFIVPKNISAHWSYKEVLSMLTHEHLFCAKKI